MSRRIATFTLSRETAERLTDTVPKVATSRTCHIKGKPGKFTRNRGQSKSGAKWIIYLKTASASSVSA